MQMVAEKIPATTKQYYRNKEQRNVKRVNIDIPYDLWDKVCDLSYLEGTKKRDIVIQALEEYLKTKEW